MNPGTRKRHREQERLRLERMCRHYRGQRPWTNELECALGLNIRELAGEPQTGWLLRIPCNRMPLPSWAKDVVKAQCDRFEPHTDADIAREEAELEALKKRFAAVPQLIAAIKRRHGNTNASGTVTCPQCGGNLQYSVAAVNGHVWGRCATKGCLSWME